MNVLIQEPAPIVVSVADEVVNVALSTQALNVSVSALAGSLSTVAAAADVNMTGASEGALLVYRASTQKFDVRNLITVSTSAPTGGQDGDLWFKYDP